MSTGDRRTVYFSKRKDQDVFNYIKQFLHNDEFSHVAKQLMRDGMKYRKEKRTEKQQKANVTQSNTMYENVIPQEQPKLSMELDGSKLKKKDVNKDELEERLDNF